MSVSTYYYYSDIMQKKRIDVANDLKLVNKKL